MDNNQTSGPGGIFGAVLTVCLHLMQMNWTSWIANTGYEIVKIIVVGGLGGAAGVIGAQLMKKYYKNKKS